MDCPPSPATSEGSVGLGGLRGTRARSCSHAQSIISHCHQRSSSAQSQATNDGQETSSESESSHEEEDAPQEDEYVEVCEGDAEVLSNCQVASYGDRVRATLQSKTPSLV